MPLKAEAEIQKGIHSDSQRMAGHIRRQRSPSRATPHSSGKAKRREMPNPEASSSPADHRM